MLPSCVYGKNNRLESNQESETFGVLKNFTSFVTPGRLEQPTIPHIGIFVVGNQNGARTHGALQHALRCYCTDVTDFKAPEQIYPNMTKCKRCAPFLESL